MRALARILLCGYLLWELPAGGAWKVVAGFSDRVDCEAAQRRHAKHQMSQGIQVESLVCAPFPKTLIEDGGR